MAHRLPLGTTDPPETGEAFPPREDEELRMVPSFPVLFGEGNLRVAGERCPGKPIVHESSINPLRTYLFCLGISNSLSSSFGSGYTSEQVSGLLSTLSGGKDAMVGVPFV